MRNNLVAVANSPTLTHTNIESTVKTLPTLPQITAPAAAAVVVDDSRALTSMSGGTV
jgi:hypothetical protein